MFVRIASLILALALAASAVSAQAPICLSTKELGVNPTNAQTLEFEAIFDQPVRMPDSGANVISLLGTTPFTVNSIFREALTFTSSSHRAISQGPVDMSGDYTVEFWFRSDTAGQKAVFSYALPTQDNALTYFANGLVWEGNLFRGTATPATLNVWHHVAMVRDTSTSRFRVYFDGVLDLDIVSTVSQSPNGLIVLGEDQDTFGGGFDPAQALDGAIDEVRIWNTARSAGQLDANRFSQVSGNAAGLAHYWRCNFVSDQGTAFPGNTDVPDVGFANETHFALAGGLGLDRSQAPSSRHRVKVDMSSVTSSGRIWLRVNQGVSGGISNMNGDFLTSNPNGTQEAHSNFRPCNPPTVTATELTEPVLDSTLRQELAMSDDVFGVTTATVNVGGPAPGIPDTTYEVKSIFENALPLNGVNGYLRNPSFPLPNQGDMTVEFWFRTTNPSACLFSYATPTQPNTLTIFADGTVFVDNTTVMTSCNQGQLDGEWHHMRITRSTTGVMWRYIDASLSGIVSNADSIHNDPTGYLVIGNDQDTFGGGLEASQAIDGAIDEIRVWTKFDSMSYLDNEHMRTADPASPDLVAYYRCESVGNFGVFSSLPDDIEDLSGNGNHIDVQGGSAPTDMIDHGRYYYVDFDFSGSTVFVEYDPAYDGSITTYCNAGLLPPTSGEPAGSFVRVEDLTCEVTVNGSGPLYGEVDLNPGDQVEIRVDSPMGSHDFITVPLVLGQILPTGFEPVTTVGFPEVRMGFGLSPAPFIIYDGGTISPFGGGVMSPSGINISAIAPPGASGDTIVIQPIVSGSSTANNIFAAGNILLLNL